MDYKNLKRVIELIRENDLREFEMENEGFRLVVKRGLRDEAIPVAPYPMAMAPGAIPPLPAAGAPAPAATDAAADAAAEDVEVVHITSPMVGIFYMAPSPEAKAYVSVGSEVNADSVVCIIEAMKVMNELKAGTSGIIREILVENGTPVEFGQPLYRIDPV